MRSFLRQLRPAFIAVVVMTLLCGVIYPLVATAIGQAAFNDNADGSLIRRDGVVVGSELIGQSFVVPEYFHPRPSAAGDGYDGGASSPSNLGPLNPDLLAAVEERAVAYREENGMAPGSSVPVDAVTASGSGLDPHISIANARLQIGRVAEARGLAADAVAEMVDGHTDGRYLGVLGEPGVNVLELNLALDDLVGA